MARQEIKTYFDDEYRKCDSCGRKVNYYKAFECKDVNGNKAELITCGPICHSKHFSNEPVDVSYLVRKWSFCFALACGTMYFLMKICGK